MDTVDFSVGIPWPGDSAVLEWPGAGGAKRGALEWRGKKIGFPKANGDVNKIFDSGPDSSNAVFIVLGDGYTAADLDLLHDDAADIMVDHLAEPPFDAYSSYLDVYTLDTASNESGADHPSDGLMVDTAFGASFSDPLVLQLLTVDFEAVLAAAATELALHEMGHTFAQLTDEYEAPCPTCDPFEGDSNATDTTVLEDIPWRVWIEDYTPIPTPDDPFYASEVGLFEGARYQSLGMYRSKRQDADSRPALLRSLQGSPRIEFLRRRRCIVYRILGSRRTRRRLRTGDARVF